MKYLLFLCFPFLAFSQTIENQALFTASQKTYLKNLITNDSWVRVGSPDDVQFLLDQKNAFDANVNISTWNLNWDDGIQGSFSSDSPIEANGIRDEIHYAALYAYLMDDTVLAQKVMDKLLDYAQNPQQDTRTKSASIDFSFFGLKSTPWYFISVKMLKFIESYALVKNLTTRTAQENTDMYNWFEGWYWGLSTIIDARTSSPLGDWKNENFVLRNSYNTLVTDGNDRSSPMWTGLNGDDPKGYTVTLGQEMALNAGSMGLVNYMHAFGVYFGDSTAINLVKIVYRLWLKLAVFPDGTDMNYYRGSSANRDNGVGYAQINLSYFSSLIMRHYKAGLNGNPNATDGNYFLEYTTSEGSDELFPNFVGNSTSGGSKNFLAVAKAHLKFLRQYGNQGWSPQRYYKNSDYLLDGSQNKRMTHRPAMALINQYYKDQELEDGWKMLTNKGYVGAFYAETGAIGSTYEDPTRGHRNMLYGLMYLQNDPNDTGTTVNVSSVDFTNTEIFINISDTINQSYTILPLNATNQAVSFYSQNTAIVSNAGVALQEGIANYFVETTDGQRTDFIKVNVLPDNVVAPPIASSNIGNLILISKLKEIID